ncbi:MAG: hypothetical protein IPL95_00975 [Saprospiraceae bacterium]|nr:hypothetical protein [Saprospiraceae bacterium]
MSQTYTPSGKFSIFSILLFLILAFLVFPLLGYIYALCLVNIPFVYINFLLSWGFGMSIGFLLSKVVISFGKVRNKRLELIFGILGGFIALYFHWAIWLTLIMQSSFSTESVGSSSTSFNFSLFQSIVTHPVELFKTVTEINGIGTWGIKSSTIKGGFLWFIWAVEFLGIMFFAITATNGAELPFCEVTNKWFKRKTISPMAFIKDKDAFLASIENSDYSYFEALEKGDKAFDHSSLFLYNSEMGENYLTVVNHILKVNSKGESEFEDDNVVFQVNINDNLVNIIDNKSN